MNTFSIFLKPQPTDYEQQVTLHSLHFRTIPQDTHSQTIDKIHVYILKLPTNI